MPLLQVDSYSFGVVLWELITREHSERGNWRPVRVPEECPAEVEALLQVKRRHGYCPELVAANVLKKLWAKISQVFPLH